MFPGKTFHWKVFCKKKKEEKEKGTFGETKHYNLVPTSKCVVLFVVFKLRWLHLKCTCKYLYDPFTDRALEDETCSFSKEHKIIPCFCLSFSILASKESDIGTRLPGKCQVSLDQHSPVSYLYLQKLSVQCRNSPCNAETLYSAVFLPKTLPRSSPVPPSTQDPLDGPGRGPQSGDSSGEVAACCPVPAAAFRCRRALGREPNWGWILTLKVGFLKGTTAFACCRANYYANSC